jgi:hypothetical protein
MNWGKRIDNIFKRTEKLIGKHEKISRLHTFLNYCHILIQKFIIITKRYFVLEIDVNIEGLELWTLLVLLCRVKKYIARQNIYE